MANRNRVTEAKLAIALRHRAVGATITDACKHAGISKSAFDVHRVKFGPARWDQALAELRSLAASGWAANDLTQRAKQLLLGRDVDPDVLRQTDEALTWEILIDSARKLFAGKAENARGAQQARFERLASAAYWDAARAKVEHLLGTPVDGAPPARLLRALWITARAIEGVQP